MAAHQSITLRNGEQITLTEREIMFCNYYLGECNKNATQSAIKAGYSERTAKTIATQNLSKLHLQKYLKDKTDPILEALGVSHERLIKKLRDQAFTDLSDLVDDDWNLLSKSEIPKEFHAAMAGVEIDEKILIQKGSEDMVLSRKTKYKLKDNIKALITLCEMSGLISRTPAATQAPAQVNLFQQINNYIEMK